MGKISRCYNDRALEHEINVNNGTCGYMLVAPRYDLNDGEPWWHVGRFSGWMSDAWERVIRKTLKIPGAGNQYVPCHADINNWFLGTGVVMLSMLFLPFLVAHPSSCSFPFYRLFLSYVYYRVCTTTFLEVFETVCYAALPACPVTSCMYRAIHLRFVCELVFGGISVCACFAINVCGSRGDEVF